MAKKKELTFPHEIRVGAIMGTIYCNEHRTRKLKNGKPRMVYTGVCGRKPSLWQKQSSSFDKVDSALRLHMAKLAVGEVAAAGMTKEDRDELLRLRALSGDTPPTVALKEWVYEQKRKDEERIGCTPTAVEVVMEAFIKDGKAAGKQHERTYRSKLTSTLFPVVLDDDGEPVLDQKGNTRQAPDSLRGRHIHSISEEELTGRLLTFSDHGTRNDYRKKCIALWTWARLKGYIAKGLELAPAQTTRAKEIGAPVGICTPETYGRLLMYIQDYHHEYLAAAVLAGLVWMRIDEVHGKRESETERQLWSDIHLDRETANEGPFLNVSYAKHNTPAWRKAPLCQAAVEWLLTIPEAQRTGDVCARFAMQRVRAIAKTIGLEIPSNALRHSCLSYGVELHQDKAKVAIWAGTSVQKLDQNYRRPVSEAHAKAWFSLSPTYCRKHFQAIIQKTPAENGALGGASKSPAKLAAVTENLKAARAAKAAGVDQPEATIP